MSSVLVEDILAFLRAKEIAFEYKGNSRLTISGFSALDEYIEGTITWVKAEEKWKHKSVITLAIVQKGVILPIENQIICESSKEAFFSIIEHYFEDEEKTEGTIGNGTVIGKNVLLGKNVCIGNNCSITGNVEIGDNTVISDNVVIRNHVIIGSGCQIQALAVIGEDGFGYYEDDYHVKTMIRHHGGVRIGNNVFIGSHVNIARGTLTDTVISNGVKIAPSTHIGHNNQIGENAVVICSQLYGSVQLGYNSYVVGSIIRNQSAVGQNAVVGMGSVVTKNVEENCVVYGVPAEVKSNL